MISQCRLPAPVHHHLRPFTTYSSPSRRMSIAMFVASDDATSGSVIAKHERIDPSSSGLSQRACGGEKRGLSFIPDASRGGSSARARAFCSAEPKRAIVSMLPVSGLVQFVACAANSVWQLVPMISHRSAYCKFVSPPDACSNSMSADVSAGSHRFHSPRRFAARISSTSIGGCVHSVAPACAWFCAANSSSRG